MSLIALNRDISFLGGLDGISNTSPNLSCTSFRSSIHRNRGMIALTNRRVHKKTLRQNRKSTIASRLGRTLRRERSPFGDSVRPFVPHVQNAHSSQDSLMRHPLLLPNETSNGCNVLKQPIDGPVPSTTVLCFKGGPVVAVDRSAGPIPRARPAGSNQGGDASGSPRQYLREAGIFDMFRYAPSLTAVQQRTFIRWRQIRRLRGQEPRDPPVDKSPGDRVKIAENVAAAKTFLELYYQNLGSNALHSRMSLRQLRLLKSRQSKAEDQQLKTAGIQAVREIGRGSFGVVRLVRRNTEGSSATFDGYQSCVNSLDSALCQPQYYALKSIRKASNLISAQEAHLRCERDLLVKAAAQNSLWIVKLHCAFQDENSLHLLMEFAVGGDFLQLLIRCKWMDENTTRFYIAEMLLAIEETHKLGIVHRDLKPNNFLITSLGHIKLADFGLAFDGELGHHQSFYNVKRVDMMHKVQVDIPRLPPAPNPKSRLNFQRFGQFQRQPQSLVGTSQYMAPEILRNMGYDGRCDWWSLGIIMFECLYSFTPFCGDTRDATKRLIAQHHGNFALPQSPPAQKLSREACDLILQLIRPRESRIGYRAYECPGNSTLHVVRDDAEDIKSHQFFANVPWDNMHNIHAPWIPGDDPDGLKHAQQPGRFPTPPSKGLRSWMEPSLSMAKDPILRDRRYSASVMEVRKKTAFLGYEWRNPAMDLHAMSISA